MYGASVQGRLCAFEGIARDIKGLGFKGFVVQGFWLHKGMEQEMDTTILFTLLAVYLGIYDIYIYTPAYI